MSSYVALLLVILAASSLTLANLAPASVTSLSVPEFTVKLVSDPYDVPATYEIDSFTGKNVTIQEGFHAENRSIEIMIRNQPFSSDYCLFYNVRYKGHFEESWTELYSYDHSSYSSGNLPPQSNSEYTALSFSADYPPNAQVDFQVEALLWYYTQVFISDHPMAPPPINEIGHYEQRLTLGETSGWSDTQTLLIPAENATPPADDGTPSGGGTQLMEQLLVIMGVVIAFILVGAGLLVYFKKRNQEVKSR